MLYLDANVILRYLLADHEVLSVKAIEIIENNDLYLKNEVLAEVVYVLFKTYRIAKNDVKETLQQFINNSNIYLDSKEVAREALEIFEDKNIDFVDALLCAYSHVSDLHVVTFDKKLEKCLNNGML